MRSLIRTMVCMVIVLVTGIDGIAAAGGEEGAAEQREGGGQVLIAGVPTYLDRFDSFLLYSKGMEDKLNELGIDYNYVLRAPSGGFSDHTGQRSIFEDMMVLGADILMTLPTSIETQHAAWEMIVDEYRTPLVITDFLDFAEGARELENENLVKFASYEHRDMGQAVADYIAANYPPGTKMAMIHGIPGVITENRASEDLHIANGMDIIYRHFADFNREKAYEATDALLIAHPDVEIILGMNSTMAIGVTRAVEEAGMLDQVDVFGFGGIIEELQSVAASKMKATASRNHFDVGEFMADLVVAYTENRWEDMPRTFAAPITVYDSAETLGERLDPRYYPMLDEATLQLMGVQ